MSTIEAFNTAVRNLSPEGKKAFLWATKQAIRQFQKDAAAKGNGPAVIRQVLLGCLDVMSINAAERRELESLILEITAENLIEISEVR